MKYSTQSPMWHRCKNCKGVLQSIPDRKVVLRIDGVPMSSAEVRHKGKPCNRWTDRQTQVDCLPIDDDWLEGVPQ